MARGQLAPQAGPLAQAGRVVQAGGTMAAWGHMGAAPQALAQQVPLVAASGRLPVNCRNGPSLLR